MIVASDLPNQAVQTTGFRHSSSIPSMKLEPLTEVRQRGY